MTFFLDLQIDSNTNTGLITREGSGLFTRETIYEEDFSNFAIGQTDIGGWNTTTNTSSSSPGLSPTKARVAIPSGINSNNQNFGKALVFEDNRQHVELFLVGQAANLSGIFWRGHSRHQLRVYSDNVLVFTQTQVDSAQRVNIQVAANSLIRVESYKDPDRSGYNFMTQLVIERDIDSSVDRIDVLLDQSNPEVASIPPSVFFQPNQTRVFFGITPLVSSGTTVIVASHASRSSSDIFSVGATTTDNTSVYQHHSYSLPLDVELGTSFKPRRYTFQEGIINLVAEGEAVDEVVSLVNTDYHVLGDGGVDVSTVTRSLHRLNHRPISSLILGGRSTNNITIRPFVENQYSMTGGVDVSTVTRSMLRLNSYATFSIKISGRASSGQVANFFEDMNGGVEYAGQPTHYRDIADGGVDIISFSRLRMRYRTSFIDGVCVDPVILDFFDTPRRTMDGGVEITSTTRDSFFHPSASCQIIDTTIFCGCVDPINIAGGATFGTESWVATDNDADGLHSWHPLATETETEIAHRHYPLAFGDLEISNGIICEPAEKFRSNRYYQLATYPSYWHGFTTTLWYKFFPNENEQTLFSIDPALRLGITWLGEPTIAVQWDDGTAEQIYSDPLSLDEWHHIAIRFNPSEALELFVDGVLASQTVTTGDFFGVADLAYIGNFENGSYIIGDMQDVRIYHGARSHEFIKAERDSFCQQWISAVDS